MENPDSIRAVRNFVLLTKFFGSMPPEVLKSMADTVVAGATRERPRQAPGLLTLLWRLRRQNIRHALSVMLDLMESLGKGL